METITAADVGVINVSQLGAVKVEGMQPPPKPQAPVNGMDVCVAVVAAHPHPDAHMPDSPIAKLCEVVKAYISQHRTEVPNTIPPPMDAVIRTDGRNA